MHAGNCISVSRQMKHFYDQIKYKIIFIIFYSFWTINESSCSWKQIEFAVNLRGLMPNLLRNRNANLKSTYTYKSHPTSPRQGCLVAQLARHTWNSIRYMHVYAAYTQYYMYIYIYIYIYIFAVENVKTKINCLETFRNIYIYISVWVSLSKPFFFFTWKLIFVDKKLLLFF